MDELERILIGNSAAAPAAQIVEGVNDELAHREIAAAPRARSTKSYGILSSGCRLRLNGTMRLKPLIRSTRRWDFPLRRTSKKIAGSDLCQRFLQRLELAAITIHDPAKLARVVRCPSPPGAPVRIMTVREQLESLAAHNAYHFGRIVLMRQIEGAWPPPSGGDTW